MMAYSMATRYVQFALLGFSLLSAQTPLRDRPGPRTDLPAQQPRPSDDPLLRWMDRIAQQELQRGEDAIAEVRTVAGAERRKHLVREKILRIMGGCPATK